jgi:hypothetical protein
VDTLAGMWPLYGLTIQTPRLTLRLAREYIDGNHASEQVSRKLGYTGNGQHLIQRDDTGRTTEYRLRLDRSTWSQNRSGTFCTVTGIEPCLGLFGVATATT